MRNCDVIVIGAGIAGASVAYELAAQVNVIVLERESQPGYHSTGRSAALYTENYGSDTIRALAMASRPFFEAPPEGFAEYPLLGPRGALFIAREDQIAMLESAYAKSRQLVSSIRLIDTAEALSISPSLKPEYVKAALYEPEAQDLDVHAIHAGFLKGLVKRGGEIVSDAEVDALTRDGDAWEVKTRAGDFMAPIIVNAAGAWCDVIAELAGVAPLGLVPKRRTAFTFEPTDGQDVSDWPLTIDISEEFYFKPDAGLLLGSPADETPTPPCDAQPEELDLAIAIDRIQTASSLKVKSIAHSWAGLRSFVEDKNPVLGMDDQAEGFFWLAGQGGYGIMTAPAMARAATALITATRLPEDLLQRGITQADLSPSRLRPGT